MSANYRLSFARAADEALSELESPQHRRKLKKVQRALGRIEIDPRYPGLQSHKYSSMRGTNGEEVWDSYVENNTPSAWRISWHYGPGAGVITVVAITPHP